ncbi:MAG: UDP-3-O-acyl-N-acetylglucosamine deacetylase [Alphaproteobacteria bacterium]|nr:UDP-3-O-acyl-N-acetylglucosamine deacetylase [Alphaproteobacteria bacterium]MCB9697276.1 UDP-3-O-acyl-N-acetylglucosamine deacetylase [Alphaproteobacteria bacterium]
MVERAGIGLHGGLPTRVRLLPATLGSGIRFRTRSGEVPADLAHAAPEPGATVLRAGDVVVRTPEHLLATLAALGVWDVAIELEGDELPALDGSAAGWVDAVDEAGRVPTGPLEPRLPSGVARIEADGVATLEPGASVGVAVAYDDGPSGLLEVPATEEAFRAEVAWARTFVLARDVPRLLAAGRGRGASEANTVVWPTSELRAPDEPVRHKLLDAWGDLALAGPIRARWFVERGHHQLHVHALREALA